LAPPDALAVLVDTYPSDLVVVHLENERDPGLKRNAVQGVLVVRVGEQEFEVVACGVLADVEGEVMDEAVAEVAESELRGLRVLQVVVKVKRDSETCGRPCEEASRRRPRAA
jgi:hypothetical protein